MIVRQGVGSRRPVLPSILPRPRLVDDLYKQDFQRLYQLPELPAFHIRISTFFLQIVFDLLGIVLFQRQPFMLPDILLRKSNIPPQRRIAHFVKL